MNKRVIGWVVCVIAYIMLFWLMPLATLEIRSAFQAILAVHWIVIFAGGLAAIIIWCFD